MDLALSLFTTGPAAPASFAQQPTKYPCTTPNHFLSLLLFQATTSFPTIALISNDVAKLKNIQFLRKTFESVYAMMVRERNQSQFVILCPVDQSLMGKNELLGTEWEWGGIDEDFVTSHIIRIPHREKPETRHTLSTLNGRHLIVTDTTVTTAKGFRLLKQARLVAEKVVYDNEGRGWIVHFIDRPLVGINQEMPKGRQEASPQSMDTKQRASYSSPDRTSTSSPSLLVSQQQQQHPLTQPQRLSAGERESARRSPRPSTDETVSAQRNGVEGVTSNVASVGGVGGSGNTVRRSRKLTGHQYPSYQNWTNARGAYELVHHVNNVSQPVLTLPTVLQRFPGLSARLEQTIMIFNDETMNKTDLDDIRTSVDQLLAQVIEILNHVDPNVLLGVLKDHNLTVDGLNLLVEDYILNSTYDIVFFKVTLQLKQQDWELAEAIRELQHLDLAQVGLEDTLTNHRSLVSALNEFQSIGVLRTPKEKLQCLVQYVRVTSALSGGGADDLIPILLLTILRSGISNLASNLYYMKHFILFGDATSGEYGYSLSTLEAVSRYIHDHAKQLTPLSQLNHEYWQSIIDGDLDKVINIRQDQNYLDMTARALLTVNSTSSANSRRTSDASITKPNNEASTSVPSSGEGRQQQKQMAIETSLSSSFIPPSTTHSSATIKAAPYNTRDAQGNTDVMIACKANQMHILKLLLEQQHVSANVCNFEGTSLLMLAVELEQHDMVKLILQHLTKKLPSHQLPHQTSEEQETSRPSKAPNEQTSPPPLVRKGNLACEDGINHQDVYGQTALHVCIERGNLELLNLLLEANANITLANDDGDSPLILASKLTEKDLDRYRPIVERLIETMSAKGIGDISTQVNNLGNSAFHYLADPSLISLLASTGANPDVDNYAGWTPLLKWALHDNTEAVRALIITGNVDFLMTDSRGYTALHMACLRGNVSMARMLLVEEDKVGTNEEADQKGSMRSQQKTMETPIRYRMPIDLQSLMDGATPLQLACQSGAVPIVEFLLRMGANPQLRDWANELPSDMTSDPQILELLDNANLFWDSRQQQRLQRLSSSDQSSHLASSKETPGEKRVIRVVRGAVDHDGHVRYIVKSSSTSSRSDNNNSDDNSVVTMERSLEDFKFLRKCLLVEYPDICIPSLEGFYSPFLLSPSRPSKIVMSGTSRRLDMFLNYLSDHPLLKEHELLWEFMLMPELQKEMISTRSQRKQESALDTVYDSFPHHVDHLENEEEYFKMLQQTMMQLNRAIKQAQCSARKLHRSIQDVPQQLEDYAYVLENADQIDWREKSIYIQALRTITATQSKMHTSDIESIGDLFEDFSFVVEGTLRALQHPQEVIASIRTMRKSYERMQRAQKRSEALWQGLSTIGEGALSAIEGAGAAIGAAGHAATTFALTTVGVTDRTALSSPLRSQPNSPSSTATGGVDVNETAASTTSEPPASEVTADGVPSSLVLPPDAHLSSSPARRSMHGRAVSSSPSYRSLSTLPVKDLSASAISNRSASLSRATGGKSATAMAGSGSSRDGQQTLAPAAPVPVSSSSPLSFLTNAPSLSFLPLPSFSFGSSSSTRDVNTTPTAASSTPSRAKNSPDKTIKTGGSDYGTPTQASHHHHQQQASSSSLLSSMSTSTSESAMEELEVQMGRASSLLNAMHGALADELAHLQHHHTQALERAMRDFGARQLKIERSRLRDMMEILTELRMQLGPSDSQDKDRLEMEETSLQQHQHQHQHQEAEKKTEPAERIEEDDSEEADLHTSSVARVVAGSGRVRGIGPYNLYGWTGASEHGEETQLTLDAVLSLQHHGARIPMGSDNHDRHPRESGGMPSATPSSQRARRRHGSDGGQSLFTLEDDEKAELKLLQRQMEIQQSIDDSLIDRLPSSGRRGRSARTNDGEDGHGHMDGLHEDSLSEKVSFD
ncbi:hypothetical protein BGW41_006894 [Actinomortierella wolfii]|nr:hypothetical protein BGW41_006894 [Actinomortierella wolfii]